MDKCQMKRRYVTLDRHTKVESYDDAFMDEGSFMVTLAAGWARHDAAATLEDDPDGRLATHGFSAESVRDAVEKLRDCYPCKCGRCHDKLERENNG